MYSETKFQKIHAKCILARQHFAQALNNATFAASKGEANLSGARSTTFATLKTPSEYNAGFSYIVGAVNKPFAMWENGSAANSDECPPAFSNGVPTLTSVTSLTNLTGLLTPMTLAEFCSRNSITEQATRVYLSTAVHSSYSYNQNNAYFGDENGNIKNEFAQFAEKIVPIITWYYTNSAGERTTTDTPINISYPFTANAVVQNAYRGSPYYEILPKTKTTNVTTFLGGVPYLQKGSSSCQPLNLNGAFRLRWQPIEDINKYPDSIRFFCSANSTPYYQTLLVGNAATSGAGFTCEGSAGLDFPAETYKVFVQFPTDYNIIPVFNSTDDIIKLFDDYGVFVTTSLDDVLVPPESPDGIVNPDPPTKPIDSFPDNTTEITPINKTYITPATFGQAMVYTPTTLKNFLSWVCDSTVDISNWARLFANPADVITGINLFNLDIVQHDSARVTAQDKTNILGVETAIPNYALQDGYNNIVDGGSLRLLAYYGNYADFTSMTYQMFIPFVGFISLRASDVVNKTIHLYYAVDFSTGAAVAFVNSDEKLIYTSPCSVAGKIPLSVSDKNSQTINNTLGIIGGIGGLISGIASGNVVGGVGSLTGAIGNLQLQTNYANRGSLSATNIYELLPAFIERTRYDLFLPSGEQTYLGAAYQTAAGAPTTEFAALVNAVDANGYIECEFVKLNSSAATEEEQAQIISLLKSGVYL